MTLSRGLTRRTIRCKTYKQDIKEGVKDDHGLAATNSDMPHDSWSKDSLLHIPDLERNRCVADKDRSGPSSPLTGQNDAGMTQALCLQDFPRNRNTNPFLLDDRTCQSRGAEAFHTDEEKEPNQKRDSNYKLEETPAKSAHAKRLAEEEKIRERSRKGRERSLRTRRRNIARLRLLEENCAHFSKENNVLRELAQSLGNHDTERVIELVLKYSLLNEEKPEAHKLSQSESYYMNLLSPLSVTASTAPGEPDSKARKSAEGMSKTSNSLIPCTYKGLPARQSADEPKGSHAPGDVDTSHVHTSVQETASNISIAGENYLSSAGVFHSVFADPAYCETKDFGFNFEDIYEQPPLSAEEICHLLEDGKNQVELLRL